MACTVMVVIDTENPSKLFKTLTIINSDTISKENKMKNIIKNTSKGFTLIELVMVTIILGIN